MNKLTEELLKQWRREAENTFMHSALGEYTPDEFLQLLDAYEAQSAELKRMSSVIDVGLNRIGSCDYMSEVHEEIESLRETLDL